MVSSLLKIGFKSLDHLASSKRRDVAPRRHPLAAYPRLQAMLVEAERSGALAAERRRIIDRRWRA